MRLPEHSRFEVGLCPEGFPLNLYETSDGAAGFLGYDPEGPRLVEIHRLPIRDETYRMPHDSFIERVEQALPLRHPNLAALLEFDEDQEDRRYFVCEFVEGERLDSFLARISEEKLLPRELGFALILQLADLIAFLISQPRLLSGIRLDDFAVALDRGRFLSLRLTDFGFDREEHPVRDMELAVRWIQTVALLLEHFNEGRPFSDTALFDHSESDPVVDGPLKSLILELRSQPDLIAFREVKSLKDTLLKAAGFTDGDQRFRDPGFGVVKDEHFVPRGPLYSLMRSAPEFADLADELWCLAPPGHLPGPDNLSPFTLQAESDCLQNLAEGSPSLSTLEILPPERILSNTLAPLFTSKMLHPYLKKHPNILRSRSIHCESDFTVIACEYVNGFSLMSLVSSRACLQPAEVRHIARQLDRLLIHLDDAADLESGGLNPWKILFCFENQLPAGEVGTLKDTISVCEWPGHEVKLRIEQTTDALAEPECSSWKHLCDEKLNGKRLATLTLWMLESSRIEQALSEGTAESEPLSRHDSVADLFEKAGRFLDEKDPAQRLRFLDMLDERLKPLSMESDRPEKSETTAPSIEAKAIPPPPRGTSKRQRFLSRRS